MKRIITFFLLIGLLITFLPLPNLASPQEPHDSEMPQNRKLKRQQKMEVSRLEANKKEQIAKEQKKRNIEAKEKSVDKNKKVKKFTTDQDLPETAKKRNIP